jgi:hypothetical protein
MQTKDEENLLDEIIADVFPNLGKCIDYNVQALRTSSRHDHRRISMQLCT